jgi:hypothetical protein
MSLNFNSIVYNIPSHLCSLKIENIIQKVLHISWSTIYYFQELQENRQERLKASGKFTRDIIITLK